MLPHLWQILALSSDMAFFIWLLFCVVAFVMTPPFFPKFFGIVKDDGKGIFDLKKHSDIIPDGRLVFCFHYLVVEHPHLDDRDDDLSPCLKVTYGLLAKSLVESFPDPG
jgi:hypothetical protein